MPPVNHRVEVLLPDQVANDYEVASPSTLGVCRLTLFHPQNLGPGVRPLEAYVAVQEDGSLFVMANSVEHFPHGEKGWEEATLAAIRGVCELHGLDPDPNN